MRETKGSLRGAAQNLEDVLADLDLNPSAPTPEPVRSGQPVTIWLPGSAKARYDRLQERSRKQFSKKVRQAVLMLIDLAEAKAS